MQKQIKDEEWNSTLKAEELDTDIKQLQDAVRAKVSEWE